MNVETRDVGDNLGKKESGRIPTLDGLRAVAILVVMLSHANHGDERIAQLGHMGVLIFFALSGYLITTRLLAEYQSTGRVSLRDFYLRRAFRILPPAVTYLAILWLLTLTGIVVCSASAIRAALFFYVNYIDVGDLGWRAGHFWSLSVEEHFYALWPLLLLGFGVVRGARTAIAAAAVILVWRPIDHHFHILAQVFHNPHLIQDLYGTDVIADALLWGCALAFFKLRSGATVSTVIALVSVTLLALISAGVRLPFPPHNAEYLFAETHFLPAMLLAAIVSCPTAPIGRFLETAPMRFIGHLSYSLYIWQQLFLGGPGPKLSLGLGLLGAFICAYASYRWIERPAIAAGRRFIQRRKVAAIAAS
jgi:peptidoglycan/LPS O-acetylase OafA/YrhL